MRITGEQQSKIFGLYNEGLQNPTDLCLAMNGELSIAQIAQIIDSFHDQLCRERRQTSSHITYPPLTKHFPPCSGHIPGDGRVGRIPGCDGQNGPDADYSGDHDRYGADTD